MTPHAGYVFAYMIILPWLQDKAEAPVHLLSSSRSPARHCRRLSAATAYRTADGRLALTLATVEDEWHPL